MSGCQDPAYEAPKRMGDDYKGSRFARHLERLPQRLGEKASFRRERRRVRPAVARPVPVAPPTDGASLLGNGEKSSVMDRRLRDPRLKEDGREAVSRVARMTGEM